MKPLSTVLDNTLNALTEPKKDLSPIPEDGLKKEDGTTNQLTVHKTRSAPLTETQLTEIAFQTLQMPLEISYEKKKVYGRKQVSDGNGDSYFVDHEPVGEENVCVVLTKFRENASLSYLRAALALSPKESTLRHLTRLAIHKKFGSNDADRAILLSDYVTALSDIPEFILFMICKNYWENDRRPFIPFIGEIRSACITLMEMFLTELNSPKENKTMIETEKKPQITADRRFSKSYKQLSKEDWLLIHWDEYLADAEGMIETAKKYPTMFNVEEWTEELVKRKALYAQHEEKRLDNQKERA